MFSKVHEREVGLLMQDYESPKIVDLGAFEELTQKGTGVAQDSAESSGSKV